MTSRLKFDIWTDLQCDVDVEMSIYRYHVVTGDKFFEDEASAYDMASMIDMLRDMYGGKEDINLMYVEEVNKVFDPADYLITGPASVP